MSRRFLGENGEGYYHVVSRVVDRRFIFGAVEKAYFRRLMGRLLGFSGLRPVTYCLMSNHFHLLVEVPDGRVFRGSLSDEDVLGRLRHLYEGAEVDEIARRWVAMRSRGSGWLVDEERAGYVRRMFDLSVFVKELKARFTRWYNWRKGRTGTLWEEPFRSVLVEGGEALKVIAAYVDLNPVRAGLVLDPKDYRYCGYWEALAGVMEFKTGLCRMLGSGGVVDGKVGDLLARYRVFLFWEGGGTSGEKMRHVISRADVDRVVRRGGRLKLREVLRCQVRYFTHGAVVGSRTFIDSVFERNRGRFGRNRKRGGRLMRFAEWGDLSVLRDLQERVIDAPAGLTEP